MSARWVCKLCPAQGLGGPDGWARHAKAEHTDGNRYGAVLSFGFAPNYSSGRERRYDRYMAPATAGEEETP